MGKRRVLTIYVLIFLASFFLIAFQFSTTRHYIGSVVYEENSPLVVSDGSGVRFWFEEALLLSPGLGKNSYAVIENTGKMNLRHCALGSGDNSIILSSSVFSIGGEKSTRVPVNILVANDIPEAGSITVILDCEDFSESYVSSFTAQGYAPITTGIAVQDETKAKLSVAGYVFIGVIIALIIARLFYRRDIRAHSHYPRPRRTIVPLELS
ncbi:hypothetical protein FJZ18_02975 [Candidatus Pacearchaeota archaeon]|nr:hypothetical protein [Candidatus Pacearchaeota archaeon]